MRSRILIEKSLTLERLGERGIVEIRFVDPQPGLTIRLTDGQSPMNVVLRGLTLVTQGLSRAAPLGERNPPQAVLIGGDSDSIESLRVLIEDSKIHGYAGIGIHGAHLILRRSTIDVDAWSVNAVLSKLDISDNFLAGARLHPGFNIGLTSTEKTVLQDNRIWVFRSSEAVEGFRWAVLINGISELGEVRATFVKNTIKGADIGVVVGGEAAVGFSKNRFIDNREYGLMLLLLPCAKRTGAGLFHGEIKGAGNEFRENGQDLCPADYPWPEGFTTP